MLHKLNKKAVVIIVAVIALVAVVGSTFAWFVTQTSLSQKFTLSSIEAGAEVYFLNGEEKVDAQAYADENGLYNLSVIPEDENYIGKLRVNVTRNGAKSCLRVTMNHQWTLADGTVAQSAVAVPYEFGENWFDNRETDYSVYYMSEDLSGEASFRTQELITGFNESSFDTSALVDGVTLKVLIQVDAVQVNRYPQLWGIEKFPWE